MKTLRTISILFVLLCLLSGMLSTSPVRSVHAGPSSLPPAGLSAEDWAQLKALLPPAQQAYLKASNTGVDDYFGYSLAISGDTLVVGTPYEDSNATGVDGNQYDNSANYAGAAYVFTRSGTTWSQQAYLKASNTDAGDMFGYSVAISGDTLVVGAPDENGGATGVNGNQADNSAGDSGAAYVFTRSGTTWTQQAYLKASNTDSGDMFGYSVAISGDTLVVGVPFEASNATGVNGNQADDFASEAGAGYVFTRSGTTWSQQAYLKASNTEEGDYFGYAVAISGDTLVVGTPYEDSTATGVNGNQADNSAVNSGAGYVFTWGGTTWTQQAYLKASNTEAYDYFGYAVAISGDTLVVSAYGEDSTATGVNGNQADDNANTAGAAYVFVRSDTTWSQQAYLKASNTDPYDEFGDSLAVSGDTLVVGASGEDSTATGVNGNQADDTADAAGAAYVFTRSGGTWSQAAYLKASNTEVGDGFGFAVAISGDTLVVGAIYEESNATGVNGNQADNTADSSGAAYVFAPSLPNSAPTDITLSANSVAEKKPVGSVVGTLTTTDIDAGDTHTYSFACSTPGVNDASFQISSSTLQTGAVFNYETKNSYAICIRTDDGNGGTYDKDFTITVTDVFEGTSIFRSAGTQDGYILESGEITNKGGTMNSSLTTLRLGDDPLKKQYRSLLSFATSSLPDNAVITKVTLKVKRQGVLGGGDPVTIFQGFLLDIRKGTFGIAPLQLTDWQALAQKTIGPAKPPLVGGWYSFNLTGVSAYINKLATLSGVTQIRMRFKLDDNNNLLANYLSLYSGNAPLAYRPQLIIEYYIP